MIKKVLMGAQNILDKFRVVDFLGPLAFRIYLIPVFWMAGTNKLMHIENTIAWFGNPDWGLGLPLPGLLAYLATFTEIIGAILLLIGLGVRWISIPLMIVMLVAIFSVHWANGWFAIAPDSSQAAQHLSSFLNWLQTNHPEQHSALTKTNAPVMLQNGIEFAVTYFIMLLSLFFTGAGKYLSVDYWLARKFKPENVK